MFIVRGFRAAALAVALGAGAQAAPALAVTSPHAHVIAIKKCSPTQTTTAQPIGFSPGFYPLGPRYYWDDVYGYPYYQRPVALNSSGSLAIDYVNVTPFTAHTIEFGLIANGRLVAEVRDVGKFSPNIEIKHSFGLDPNVFPLSTALAQCVPLRVQYNDQPDWVNPHLPALRRAIYAQPQ
jgi:hypothetical protein